jgi:type IV pilus biogenesis protein CpaD/CtpE
MITTPTPPRHPAGPLRTAGLAFAALLALAGCEAMPVGGFERAEISASRAAGPYTLYFQPDSDLLAIGEAERLTSYLRTLALTADQDILLEVGNSGSAVLDARRLQALRRSFASTRARVRVIVPHEVPRPEGLTNAVRLTVVSYDLLVVDCPSQEVADDLTTPLPMIGCSNQVNLASMAADKRDPIAPHRELEGSEVATSVGATIRHRNGQVKVVPLGSTTGN